MHSAIYLHQAKEIPVLRGHPWIFPKSIKKQSNNPITGQLVAVHNEQGERIAYGVYNEHSLYRVRVLMLVEKHHHNLTLENIITKRLSQSIALRQVLNFPAQETTAYRLFNSEGDGLSGLTIDRFNDICVISSSAYWVELHKEMISSCLIDCLPGIEILWLSQEKPLLQDGWQARVSPHSFAPIEIKEAGVIYGVDFSTAQKTGLFLDQRENHQRIAALARDKKVLDLYTYTGGFALHAAKASAAKVTAVDSSKHAISQAKDNAQRNGLSTIEFVAADARDYLAQAQDYDLIILDPPKLVPSKRDLNKAKNYYRFLHREIFKAMRMNSLLMTCNCSSALTTQDFAALVAYQASLVGKETRLLGVYGPAICHPTLPAFPEGNYLTALLLAVV